MSTSRSSSQRSGIQSFGLAAVAVASAIVFQGSACGPLSPDVARFEGRVLSYVETPGGVVDTAGGNLSIHRSLEALASGVPSPRHLVPTRSVESMEAKPSGTHP